jgi:MFS family permease
MENTTTPSGEETETEVVSTAVSAPALAEPEQPEELVEFDEDDETEEATESGFVSGAFGITSLLLAIASLGGGWLGTVYGQRSEYLVELKTTTQSAQASLNAFHSNWHGEAAIAGIFAIAALLVGGGVLTAPALLLSGRAPAWVRATALGGIIIGLIGLLLALLTWFDVLAAGLTAPPASAGG